MPIVSHTIETNTQPNGATSNVLRLYDQDGTEYMTSFFAPAGFDMATKIANAKAELDEQLASSEFEALIGA